MNLTKFDLQHCSAACSNWERSAQQEAAKVKDWTGLNDQPCHLASQQQVSHDHNHNRFAASTSTPLCLLGAPSPATTAL